MACPSHPRWGCSVGACTLGSDMERVNLHIGFELGGIQALQKISRLSSESYARVQADLGREIEISTLEAALLLARDPRTIGHLASPPVIASCIRLMNTVEGLTAADITPFSYEYGYLCFKLLVVVLNVCLLERWNILGEALTLCDQVPDQAAHVFTSEMTALLVGKQFEVLKAGKNCDWVLGWSSSASQPRQPSLLARSDITILFNLIWNDRKKFLLSLMPFTRKATGLSGLMFLFSRHIARERDTHRNPDSRSLQHKLYEIALRYTLVADSRQRRATVDVVDANKCIDDWYNAPKHTDTDDSRFMLGAYIQTMNLGDDIYETLHPTVMLRLISISINDSTQHLLPEVIRWTIEYGWRRFLSMDDEEDDYEKFAQIFLSAVSFLIRPPSSGITRLVPLTQSKIIDTMRKQGLLDWIARALIRLRPATSPAEAKANSDVHLHIMKFVGDLARVVPQRELERCFRQYVPEWWKVHQHLATRSAGLSPLHRDHYEHCAHAWLRVAEFLGLQLAIDEFASENCYNGEPSRTSGARFGCAGCIHTWYCDERCKTMNWRLVHPHPHPY